MKLGNKKLIFLTFFLFSLNLTSFAEEKILSSPLINLDELKPSFEEVDDVVKDATNSGFIKRKKNLSQTNSSGAKFIGLDKITAKTSEIIVNFGETKKFGPLEIKVLKCGKIKNNNLNDVVAYLQVKDISKNNSEKVFIFNGWTFASDPSLTPFDHAIYDLQLLNCSEA
jgi:hypothetical protein